MTADLFPFATLLHLVWAENVTYDAFMQDDISLAFGLVYMPSWPTMRVDAWTTAFLTWPMLRTAILLW